MSTPDLPTIVIHTDAQRTAFVPSQDHLLFCDIVGELIASICAVLNWDVSTRSLSLAENCITTVIRHFMCV